MKKKTIGGLSICLSLSILLNTNYISATNFEGKEDEYMEICSSSSLTASDEKTCKEFNQYLKDKNKAVKQEISKSKNEINKLATDIDTLSTTLSALSKDIIQKQNEISYLDTSITNLEASIEERENEVKERMYAMQTFVNSNFYMDFIFNADNFTDMMSRTDSINELTSYDKDLIKGLQEDKVLVEEQRQTVATAKSNLESQKKEQETLQNQYMVLLNDKNALLSTQQTQAEQLAENSGTVEQALKEYAEKTQENQITGNVNISGDSEIGKSIVKYALSVRNKPYTWGATGPNTFDCSGLVYWAYNQAGVSIGRTTAAGYSSYGKSVRLNETQAGDVVTFYNYGYVSHIGIFIDDKGTIVHAAGRENEYMGEFGGSVRVNSVYDIPGQIYNCRRMY